MKGSDEVETFGALEAAGTLARRRSRLRTRIPGNYLQICKRNRMRVTETSDSGTLSFLEDLPLFL